MNEIHTLQYDSTAKKTSISHTDPNISDSSIKAEAAQQDLCAINTDCNNLEVADSEEDDDQIAVKMKSKDSCTSLSHENRSDRDCRFIQDFSTAIANAKHLQVLDLSNNGFSEQTADTFYAAWLSGSRAIVARRHIKEQTVHLSVEGNRCCGVKPCCRKIWFCSNLFLPDYNKALNSYILCSFGASTSVLRYVQPCAVLCMYCN